MVPVALAEPPVVATGYERIEVLLGEVTVRFVGPVDQRNPRVVLELLR